MSSNDELVSFMDLLDFDEEVIDSRLKSIMERTTYTNKHLANAIHLLQYKNLINIQDDSECENKEECSFIAKIVNNIQEENIDNVCKIVNIVLTLKKSCVVSNSEHLFQQILYNLELPTLNPRGISDADTEDETSLKTLLSLRVCDSILDAVIKNGEKLTLPFLETPLENVLSSTNDRLKVYFLNNTVPRLFEGILGYNILDRIWTFLQQPETNKENALKVLSCLSMFYLPVQDCKGKTKFESEIVFHFEFWNILLHGLISSNPAARKISVYLIKRALDSLKTTKNDIHIASETKTLFHWTQRDSSKLRESWDNFFILIDSLEEKQSNIVLPSLQLFDSVIGIDSCWLNCAFNLGLKHDNAQVRLKCVEHRLNAKLGDQFDAIVLLEALNDVNLYDNQKDCASLKSKLTKTCEDKNTLVLLIKSIAKIKWSPVPMFYLSEVLAETKTDLQSTIDSVQFIQIMIEILKAPCNNIAMRNSVRLNITYFVANCFKDLSWKDLIQIYYLVQWNKFTAESKKKNPFIAMISNLDLNETDKNEFFKVVTSSQINIDFALLYLQNQKEDLDKFMELVAAKVQKIQDIANRQYADKTECFSDVVYVTQLFNKSREVDTFKDTVISILANHYKTVIQYILNILSDDIKLSIEEMVLLFEGYKSLITTLNDADVKEIILQIYKVSIMFLKDKETNLENKLFTIYILDILTDKINSNYKHEMLSLKQLLQVIKDVSFKENLTIEDNGRFRTAFYEKSCEIAYKYIEILDADEITVINNNINEIVEYIENVIECGGYGCLKWILRTINKILPNILDNDEVEFDISQFISRTWKEIEELKSNNQYAPCMEQFVKLIIQEPLLKRPIFNNLVILYCTKIVEYGSLKTTPLAYLAEELKRKNINEDYGQLICVLCEILLFAPVPKKDIRILDNVTVKIFQNQRYGFDNKAIEAHFNFSIQYSAILTLSRISNPDIFETISSIIISKIEAHLKTKQRYHGNSQLHRLLLISLQHLLFLSLLNMKVVESPMIVFWMIDLLGRLPHQPSVRICLEWFIALHFYVKKTNIDKKVIQKMKSKNIPVISQFMILFLVIKHKINNKSCSEEEYQFVMDFLLSHTMGQMFNVRLNAQYLGTELHNKQKSEKYKYIIEVIEKTFVESAKDKNFVKLQEDFFVNNFDIIEHLTPSFIYFFLPRYCEISSNENVDGIHIKNVIKEINNNIKCITSDFKEEWDKLHTNDDVVFNYDFNKISDECKGVESGESSGTIQKKYVPWKNMSDIDVYEDGKKKESPSELIVVASLIDKLPNLGGMARTSEVFGVKTYVVDSIRHLQDKQFQGLSVSAERWVNIEEVRPGQPLKDYLMKKKSEGYSVVAAEQTSTSCQLQSFKFPKKTLLLLGHEKEGIPCDFLPLMDHCVEIPQQGFVRSLNVHVTAAIFVWEYSRQNIL